jgi:hypothetical protein
MRHPSRWIAGSAIAVLIATGLALVFSAFADSSSPATTSWPPDVTNYQRAPIPEDKGGGKAGAAVAGSSGTTVPGIFVMDPNSVDFSSRSEPSIAINPTNPKIINIHGGFGGWNGNADLFHSSDGGLTWAHTTPINPPPGNTTGCPCDTVLDWGLNLLAGTFLATPDIYSGTTPDPSVTANFTWFQPTPGTTQLTDNAHAGNTDQPWLVVNRTTTSATTQNVYVGYDDFSAGPAMRVAVAPLTANLNFNVDNQSGLSGGGGINPGHRLTVDPRTGSVYSLFQFNNGGSPLSIAYIINRSTDNGGTWTLNGMAGGLTVATAPSDQPSPKFGTVNCLLGGVDHAAVDPNTGDVYVVYGNRDSVTGNNRLAIRRLQDNGAGGVNIDAESFVTGQVQAALPSVAVAADGTVGVLYDTFDGFLVRRWLPDLHRASGNEH